MVNEVVNAVTQENKSIDYTAQDFIYVQDNIASLKNNISIILDRAKDMLNVNNNTEEHINNLYDSTKEVSNQTLEAISLNNANNDKKTQIRNLLDELGEAIKRLENLQENKG